MAATEQVDGKLAWVVLDPQPPRPSVPLADVPRDVPARCVERRSNLLLDQPDGRSRVAWEPSTPLLRRRGRPQLAPRNFGVPRPRESPRGLQVQRTPPPL